jgi:hypothetical protein
MGTWIVNVLSKLEVNAIFRIQPPPPPHQTNISGHMFVLIFFIRVSVKNLFLKFVQVFKYTLYIATMLKCQLELQHFCTKWF